MIGASHRWAVSLADLLMLLLGMFVLMASRTPELIRPVAATAPVEPLSLRFAASELFQPGEAMLRPGAADRMRQAVGHPRALSLRLGLDESGRRFDGYDLAAARAAALARVLAPAGRVEVSFDRAAPAGAIVITPER